MEMKGKVVLITGGAGALGQTVVPAFVSTGASVILGDRNPVQVPGVTALKADFTDQTQVQSLVDEVIRTSGRLDALINLVGGFATGRLIANRGVDMAADVNHESDLGLSAFTGGVAFHAATRSGTHCAHCRPSSP